MVRRRIALLASSVTVAALILSACGGSAEQAAPTAASGASSATGLPLSMIGMQVEGVEVEAWPSAPFGALRLWDNGTAWSQIELKKGEFKWDNLDGAIANASSKGLTDVLMVLGTTPEWAAKKKTEPVYPPTPGANSAPKNMKDWDEWVTAVVTRYKGQITAYEIWNEASLKQFYNGTPAEMAEMTKRAYDIIKANDPDALVVAASPALRLSGPYQKFFPKYLAELAKVNWPVDVFSVHAYPAGDQTPTDRAVLLAAFKEDLAAAGAPDKPIWDTELNFGLAGPGDTPKTDVDGPAAAGWIVRAYVDSLRLGIERSYWYIWTQKPYPLLGVQAYPTSDGEKGFYALDSWVVGAEFNGCQDTNGVVTCDFTKDGQPSIIAWAQSGESAYTVPAGAQMICDPMSNCQQATEGQQITLSEVPVWLSLQA